MPKTNTLAMPFRECATQPPQCVSIMVFQSMTNCTSPGEQSRPCVSRALKLSYPADQILGKMK